MITLTHTSNVQVPVCFNYHLQSSISLMMLTEKQLCLQDLIEHDEESIVTCVFWEFLSVE